MDRLDITVTDRNVETQVAGEGVWGVSRRGGGGGARSLIVGQEYMKTRQRYYEIKGNDSR